MMGRYTFDKPVDPELLFVLFAYAVIAVEEIATPLVLRSVCLLFDSQHHVWSLKGLFKMTTTIYIF